MNKAQIIRYLVHDYRKQLEDCSFNDLREHIEHIAAMEGSNLDSFVAQLEALDKNPSMDRHIEEMRKRLDK